MSRFTLRSIFGTLVIAGLVATQAIPSTTHATSAQAAPIRAGSQTMVDRHPIVYVDSFSQPGLYQTDRVLGRQTHWEGGLNLSNPTSPLTWTRVANTGRGTGIQPNTVTNGTCGSNGIRLYQFTNLNSGGGGDCIAFYGTGPQDLTSLLYPGCWINCPTVAYNVGSFSTTGSSGHGNLSCGGGTWPFTSNQTVYDMHNAIAGNGSYCYNNAEYLTSL